jgi:vacuolar-type H+-ATPase subunit E/Vma4
MKTDINQKTEETPSVFSGYKARITEVLEKELQRLKKEAERESAKIIADAKQQAQDIINQAELKTKQESKSKVKSEIEALLARVEEEAKRVVAKAKENALQESEKLASDAQEESDKIANILKEEATQAAEELIKTATIFKQNTEQEVIEIRDKASEEAKRIVNDAKDIAKVKATEEEKRILSEAKQHGDGIIDEASNNAKERLEGAVSAVDEAIKILNEQIRKANENTPVDSKPKNKDKNQSDIASGMHRHAIEQATALFTSQNNVEPQMSMTDSRIPSIEELLSLDTITDKNEESVLYYGEVDLFITKPADPDQLRRFEEALRIIPQTSILRSDYSSSTNIAFTVSTEVAIPLFEILRGLSPVKEAEKTGKDIRITLLPPRKPKKDTV